MTTGLPAAVSLKRLLSIVLALGEEVPVPAQRLARQHGVSLRTIYRDVDRLRAAGVPISAAAGRTGGLVLEPGFRLRPLGFTQAEMVALSVAIATLAALPVRPYGRELDSAARKIAAVAKVPRPDLLLDVGRWLRVEPPAGDAFHPEPAEPAPDAEATCAAIEAFVDALLAGRRVVVDYRSPYSSRRSTLEVDPAGVIVDRGLWYLVAFPARSLATPRYLRADRVRSLAAGRSVAVGRSAQWRPTQARPWLRKAMAQWIAESPAEVEMTAAQAARLSGDWYFACGAVRPLAGGTVLFRWGEDNFERVRELVAWLGPPARLVAPEAWKRRLAEALRAHGDAQLGDSRG